MLILSCAVFFSLITTFSRLAYDAGANPLTLVEARAAAFVIVIGGFQLIARRSFALPRRTLIATFPMSVGIMVMSIGYLSSVYFIKVSLAVVILYSFPLLVGLLAAVSERERIALPKALAMLVAFGGLVMAVLGRVPVVGDQIDVDGVRLEVEQMSGRRVERLRASSGGPVPS